MHNVFLHTRQCLHKVDALQVHMAAAEVDRMLTGTSTVSKTDVLVTCQFTLSNVIIHLHSMCGCAMAVGPTIMLQSFLIPTA